MDENELSKSARKRKVSVSFDLRLVVVVLLLVIAGMLALWRPWVSSRDGDRTVEVTGQTTVKSEPDEYIFNPSYEFSNKDGKVANDDATRKSTDVVAAIKKLGVEDKSIKTSISSYSGRYLSSGTYDAESKTYTLYLTVTVATREEAQKVQDYLATTAPQGMVTPTATFSESKRKQVESSARDEATKDARQKAEQSAKNLGFKVGAVKEVTDGQGFGIGGGGVMPMAALDSATTAGGVTTIQEGSVKVGSASVVMPGQNELSYTVTVVYYLK